MKSLHIGTYFGIPVKVHWTFGLMLIWIPFLGYSEGMNGFGIFSFSVFALFLFVFVLMHEYGHALTARKFGIDTQDIILSPIGGIARLRKMPEKPIQELIVAIAGPAVNVALAIIIASSLFAFGKNILPSSESPELVFNDWNNMLPMLLLVNIVLVLFNMIPAFPMDGGRVLRALLSMKLPRLKATRIASITGQVVAVGFFGYGIYQGELILPFIGVFVFMTASYEYRNMKRSHRLNEATIEELINTSHEELRLNDTIADAQLIMERSGQEHFIVRSQEGLIIGVLHGIFLKDAIENKDYDSYIARYASDRFEPISSDTKVKDAVDIMNEKGYSILPVYKNDIFAGVIDRNMLKEWIEKN